MAKSGSKVWMIVGGLVVVVGAVAGGGFYLKQLHRDNPPDLEVTDIQDGTRQAARIERMSGKVELRPASAEDEKAQTAEAAAKPSGDWTPVTPATSIKLGTLVRADAKSSIEMVTAGNWYMGIDGEASVVLQDARRNADNSEHVFSVYVQKGTVRAKSASDVYKGYFMEITTPTAKIHVIEGEIGVSVNPDGLGGRMWLMSGKAVAIWKDGRRKELGLKGLEVL